jgi:CheY-like chemotaxis protein
VAREGHPPHREQWGTLADVEDVAESAETLALNPHIRKRHCHGLPVVSRPGLERKTVLIADDDSAIRLLVSATLASDQYTVLEAADGEEAWRLIRDHHPAVAILDWQMPVYSGLELTAVIKGDPLVRDIIVIMLTGRITPADRRAGARAEVDVYLTKPFSPQELLVAVEKALGVNQ